MTTQPRATFIETDMVSLAGYSLSDLRADQSRELADAVRSVLKQVERPRANLGGSGPPGRAD
ncbi:MULTISPECIES: hypothetical protein [Actinoplanes]|uniref:Uncharacterized protein n=2 Tax=Actinoplanes TaxID=1865 RepID=A0A124G779_9ACTN|nr:MULTISPECIES: hypothetical protein [Actinoplanes]KUL21997.1 hypothetical protein ADL15_49340 [Actinoplanes awajinensis subsp. mycoplanecinus]GIE68608.1 hypothetical protein Apa02nite_047160 [Actinoplanes palleronii]